MLPSRSGILNLTGSVIHYLGCTAKLLVWGPRPAWTKTVVSLQCKLCTTVLETIVTSGLWVLIRYTRILNRFNSYYQF